MNLDEMLPRPDRSWEGWFFIAVTAILLSLLFRRLLKNIDSGVVPAP